VGFLQWASPWLFGAGLFSSRLYSVVYSGADYPVILEGGQVTGGADEYVFSHTVSAAACICSVLNPFWD